MWISHSLLLLSFPKALVADFAAQADSDENTAVVALIAAPLFKLAKSAMKEKGKQTKEKGQNAIFLLISLAAALLIWLGHINPVWVILATIIITLCSIWLSSYRSSK